MVNALSLTVRILVFASAFSTITIFAMLIVWPYGLEYYRRPFGPEPISLDPGDFYSADCREVSLDELVKVVSEAGRTIYMPSKLPRGLKLTAIYLKDGPFIAIFVYSSEDNKDYRTAELCIEISPSGLPPLLLEELKSISPGYEYVLKINNWLVRVEKDAYIGSEELRRKYGKDRAPLAEAWIEGFNYLIGSPILTAEELLQLIQNMESITQPPP
ncbi:MAG: hypothetical protein QXM89_03260 [Candidatus Bathyarchaeia archaeon]